MSDVRRDESADVYGVLDISVPVAAPESDEQLAGIMKIVASSQEMLQGIGGLQLGSTGQVVLIRQDGSNRLQPAGRGPRVPVLRRRHPERASDCFGERPAGADQFPLALDRRHRSRRRVARSRLHESFPNLSWLVAVSMQESELVEPFRPMVWSLMVVIGLTGIAVLAVALWASMRLARPALIEAWTCTWLNTRRRHASKNKTVVSRRSLVGSLSRQSESAVAVGSP